LLRRGEHIAGRVWVENREWIELDANDPNSRCQSLREELGADFFDAAGSFLCAPMQGSKSLFVGTLCVTKRARNSFSSGDMTFIKELITVVGPGLESLLEKESQSLERNLNRIQDEFLIGLFRDQHGNRSQEQRLLKDICNALSEGLGAK